MTSTPRERGDKQLARVVVSLTGFLLAIFLLVLFGAVWVFTTDIEQEWVQNVGTIASVVLFFGPVGVFWLLANWRFPPSPAGQRALNAATMGAGVVQAISAGAIVAIGVANHAPTWLPITVVIVGAALAPTGIIVGRLLRSEPTAVHQTSTSSWPPKRGRFHRFTAPMVGLAALAAAGLTILVAHPWSASGGFGYWYAAGLAVFVCGSGCLGWYLAPASRAKAESAADFETYRRISRAIYFGLTATLTAADLELARRRATLLAGYLPWQIATMALMFGGAAIEQTQFVVGRDSTGPGIILAIAVVALALLSSSIFRLVRARQFRAGHPGRDLHALETDLASASLR